MAYCVDCASPIPDEQKTCSMCYGDPYHGTDGIMLREMERAEQERQEQEELERKQEQKREEAQSDD